MNKIKIKKLDWKFWSIFSALVFALFLVFLNYEGNAGLKTKAERAVISALGDTYNYIDNYNYSINGILVYTEAEGPYGFMNATVGGALDKDKMVTYTMIITNPHREAQKINLKFELPKGYSYQGMVSGVNPAQAVGTTGIANLTWPNINVPAGESSIKFRVKVP